jgi:hypothetical protein
MSKQVEAQVTCSSCDHKFTATLYRSIWVEQPDNRQLIFDDQINTLTCPACQFQEQAEFPFLATNVKKEFAVWYEPVPDPAIDEDATEYLRLFGPGNFYATAPRVSDWEDFKAKLEELEQQAETRPTSSKVARPPGWELEALAGLAGVTKDELLALSNRPEKEVGLGNADERESSSGDRNRNADTVRASTRASKDTTSEQPKTTEPMSPQVKSALIIGLSIIIAAIGATGLWTYFNPDPFGACVRDLVDNGRYGSAVQNCILRVRPRR